MIDREIMRANFQREYNKILQQIKAMDNETGWKVELKEMRARINQLLSDAQRCCDLKAFEIGYKEEHDKYLYGEKGERIAFID